MNIGKAVEIILETKGLSKEDLLSRLKMNEDDLQLIYQGKIKPTKKVMDNLGKALGVLPPLITFLGIERSDVPEKRQEMYDLVYPHMVDVTKAIFIKE